MAGFVLMKHRQPTALAAYALNRMYPGFHAVGSIVLNTSVGGLNPDAVEASAKLGAKVVWMPTQDAGSLRLVDAPDAVRGRGLRSPSRSPWLSHRPTLRSWTPRCLYA